MISKAEGRKREKKEGWKEGKKELKGKGKKNWARKYVLGINQKQTGRVCLEVYQDRSKFYFNIQDFIVENYCDLGSGEMIPVKCSLCKQKDLSSSPLEST